MGQTTSLSAPFRIYLRERDFEQVFRSPAQVELAEQLGEGDGIVGVGSDGLLAFGRFVAAFVRRLLFRRLGHQHGRQRLTTLFSASGPNHGAIQEL